MRGVKMSLWDDYKDDYLDDLFLYDDSYDVWTTKDGDMIKLQDMTTEHIENCLRMLRRYYNECGWIDAFEEELAMRDVIQDCILFKQDLVTNFKAD